VPDQINCDCDEFQIVLANGIMAMPMHEIKAGLVWSGATPNCRIQIRNCLKKNKGEKNNKKKKKRKEEVKASGNITFLSSSL
jgi:hypothetical protein